MMVIKIMKKTQEQIKAKNPLKSVMNSFFQ